jgi:hypothetical protein
MILTDWHHLFGITLTDYFSGTAYTVELEADLSLKKQLLDIVIIDMQEGEPPDTLPDGLENLTVHNLLSYKSVHEPFDRWAADELIGHYVNFRKQNSPSLKNLLPESDFRLYAVSTRFPRKLAGQVTLESQKKGVYDFQWGSRTIRLIVTGEISQKKKNAVWLMFSAIPPKIKYGVAHYHGRLDEMSSAVNQLIIRYQDERIIDMPYTLEDYRKEVERNVLSSITPERILEEYSHDELLKGIPTEQRLKGFPAEHRLKGIPTEQRLKGIPTEQRLNGIPPEQRLNAIPTEQRLKGISVEEMLKKLSVAEIEAYLRNKAKRK